MDMLLWLACRLCSLLLLLAESEASSSFHGVTIALGSAARRWVSEITSVKGTDCLAAAYCRGLRLDTPAPAARVDCEGAVSADDAARLLRPLLSVSSSKDHKGEHALVQWYQLSITDVYRTEGMNLQS